MRKNFGALAAELTHYVELNIKPTAVRSKIFVSNPPCAGRPTSQSAHLGGAAVHPASKLT
jgi:hypothetical protein